MNVYDSERMAELLAPLGYRPCASPETADMILLNTCHIREKAAEKMYSELGRLRQIKERAAEDGRRVAIAVAGCVAQAEGAEIQGRAPQVDLVVGPQAYHRLPELIAKVERSGGRLLDTDFPAESKFDFLPQDRGRRGPTAFLTIQEGCDKFCTFCVVPYTRGAEVSRPVRDILDEAERLANAGACEVTLLGQNVNAYHGKGPDGLTWSLADLLHRLAEVPGLERLRYTTSHPCDMDAALIAAHGALPALMPFLHLPVQSGSDRILAAMNRRHDAALYRDLAARLRAARPDLALSSDFIVGFPGESEREFEETLRLVEEVGFAQAYSFKYSPRPGTPGASLPNQVPEAAKKERLAALQALLNRQQRAFNEASVGLTMPVLFERDGKSPGQLVGRSPWMQAVHATLPAHCRDRVVAVSVEAAYDNSLSARLAEPAAQALRSA